MAKKKIKNIDVSVVIPVYYEQETLEELIERCLKSCKKLERSFEIILVDDGSRDKSRDLMIAASKKNPELVCVFLNKNYGQHSAVMAGLAESKGEIIVTLDADLQNPPEEIVNLVKEIDKGFDVVGTVRESRQDSFFRKFASSLINKAVQKATGVMMHDYGCMLRAYKRNIVNAMLQCHERSTFIPVLANTFAAKTTEIDVKHAERPSGDSKYNIWKLISLQFDLLTCMTTMPLRILSVIGTLVSFLGIAFGLMLFVLRIFYGASWAAEGVFTLFAILFIFVGAQFIAIGLLGEYIGRIYNDVRARPRYFIEKVIQTEKSQEKE